VKCHCTIRRKPPIVPALRARSLHELRVKVIAGAILGVLLAAMRIWLETDGETSILELMDRGRAELEDGLAAQARRTLSRPDRFAS